MLSSSHKPPRKQAGVTDTRCEQVTARFDIVSEAALAVRSSLVVESLPHGQPSPGTAAMRGQLSQPEIDMLWELISHEVTESTIRIYECQWRQFALWGATRRITVLPAAPAHVAVYLAERVEKLGHKPATLRVAAAAIGFVHATLELDNPCAHPDVRRTIKGATRKTGRVQRQARGLTADMLDAMRATARHPRIGRGGRLESAQTAALRGAQDIAMAALMRDAMLRVSEAAALAWHDIESAPDGSGRLLIRRSKTDPEGEGAVAFVSVQTMAELEPLRRGSSESLSMFGLHRNQISLRIKKAAAAAGLGEGFSGHSPRVGMAQDLARAGIELPSLMTAGRWQSPMMPAHYTRNESADRGAVARFYGHRRNVI